METIRTTDNKAAYQRFEDAVNTGDTKIIAQTVDEVFAPDAKIRTPLPISTSGAQAIKEIFGTLLRAFPDLHVAVEDVVTEGDKVVCRNVVTGTHRGEYMGLPPTGRSIAYDEIFIARFAEGRVAETWGVVDALSIMRQLGALPARAA